MAITDKDKSIGNVLKQIMKDQQRMFLLLDEQQKALEQHNSSIKRLTRVLGEHISKRD